MPNNGRELNISIFTIEIKHIENAIAIKTSISNINFGDATKVE